MERYCLGYVLNHHNKQTRCYKLNWGVCKVKNENVQKSFKNNWGVGNQVLFRWGGGWFYGPNMKISQILFCPNLKWMGDSRKYRYLYHGRLLGFPKGRGSSWLWNSEGMGGGGYLQLEIRRHGGDFTGRISGVESVEWVPWKHYHCGLGVVRKQTMNVWPRKQKTNIDRSDTCLCS